MKRKTKLGITLTISMMICSYIPITAETVQPGGSFTVSIGCGDVEGSVQAVASNATVASSGNFCDRNDSITVKATAGSAGTATISIVGVDATGAASTANPVDMSGKTIGSASVSVAEPVKETPQTPSNNGGSSTSTPTQTPAQTPTETNKEEKKNTDSALASLSLSTGSISPEFKADTTSYSVTLDEGTTSIEISAKANDSKASVSGTGKKDVKAGKNKIEVVCTAEDGSKTTYTINVTVKEKPVTTYELDGKTLGVITIVDDASLTNKAFTKDTVKINDTEVPAWKSEAQGLTLLYLTDEDGGNFYIYDETAQKVTSIYKPVGVLGKNLVIIDVPTELQNREGMTYTTIEIDKQQFSGWTYNDKAFANFSLIYVMDEAGNKAYYQYSASDNNLQVYSGAAAATQDQYEAALDKQQTLMYVIYGLGAACVVAIGLAGFFFFKRKPGGKGPKRVDIEKENYEDRFHIDNTDSEKSE